MINHRAEKKECGCVLNENNTLYSHALRKTDSRKCKT